MSGAITFNHGVEGSSPSALTMQNQKVRGCSPAFLSVQKSIVWTLCGQRDCIAQSSVDVLNFPPVPMRAGYWPVSTPSGPV